MQAGETAAACVHYVHSALATKSYTKKVADSPAEDLFKPAWLFFCVYAVPAFEPAWLFFVFVCAL